MKLKFEMLGASLFGLNNNTLSWCNMTEDGDCLKHGRPWTDFRYLEYDLNRLEVQSYCHKDKITKTYWLVECKILEGSGKVRSLCTVEFKPLYPVEVVKVLPGNPEYCIVKRKDW